ncbi:MAG: hypothetical protein RR066_05525 [Mucinivorans sp.]
MELVELEKLLQDCDSRLTQEVTINRDALRKLLIAKPQKMMKMERFKVIYQLVGPFLLVGLLAIVMSLADIQLTIASNFYIGLGLFAPTFLFLWSLQIRHYLLIRQVDFSAPIVLVEKQMAILERYALWVMRVRNLCMPLAIAGMLLIFIPQSVDVFYFVIMVLLVALVFTVSAFYHNYSLKQRYAALNHEIAELDALCR